MIFSNSKNLKKGKNMFNNKTMTLWNLLNHVSTRPEVPIAIVSDPGTGKTAIVEEWSEFNEIPLIKLVVSTMDITDAAGIYVKSTNQDTGKDEVKLIPPNWGIKACKERCVLFLDEFNTASKEVADSFLTIIQSRHLPSGERLHEGTIIIAAMNDSEQCDNYRLSPATCNRFAWYKHEPDVNEWLTFMCGQTSEDEMENAKASKEYLTQKEWHRRMKKATPKKDGWMATLREFISSLSNTRLEFDKGTVYEKLDRERAEGDYLAGKTVASPRSLFNLFYFIPEFATVSEMIDEVQAIAPMFVSPEAVANISTATETAAKTCSNAPFTKRRKTSVIDQEEAAREADQKDINDLLNTLSGERATKVLKQKQTKRSPKTKN